MNKKLYWLLSMFLTLMLTLGNFINVHASSAINTSQNYYISPLGSDRNECSLDAPCATIEAVPAQPEDTITLLTGEYAGQMAISLKGSPDAPITISGLGAVLDGSSVVLTESEWLTFENLTFVNTSTPFDVQTSHHITWRYNSFDFSINGLYIREHSSYLLFENNEFFQSCLLRRPWMQVKDATCEGSAVYGSSFNSGPYLIRNNYIHNVFNSFFFTDDATEEWMDVNVYIYNNHFENIINIPSESIPSGYPDDIPANIAVWFAGNNSASEGLEPELDLETVIPKKYPRALKDTLLSLSTPQKLVEWVSYSIEYDMQRFKIADSLGCDALAPEDIYRSGKAICTEFARLFCLWADLHGTSCYQVGYTTGEWAHTFAWLPEYRITLQNNGVLHEYDTDKVAAIVEQESFGQAVCFVIGPGEVRNNVFIAT